MITADPQEHHKAKWWLAVRGKNWLKSPLSFLQTGMLINVLSDPLEDLKVWIYNSVFTESAM